MLNKILVQFRYIILAVLAFVGIISCENDLTNIGVDMVDSNLFNTSKYSEALVKGWSINIDKNRTDNLSSAYLGYTKNDDFGSFRASFVTQLTLPEANPDFGENAVLDSVIITIPYYSTLKGKQLVNDKSVPDYKIDSVWNSNENAKFQLKIWELGTYLNPYNSTNPALTNEYYSNDVFLKNGTPLFEGEITPNPNDTMAVIKRRKYKFISFTEDTIYRKDSLKLANAKPAIRIGLEKSFFKTVFQDNSAGTSFLNNDNFQHFFRGLYFEALPVGSDKLLLLLNTNEANLTLYYTENQIKNEGADEDLNGNKIKGEQNVIVAKANSFVYNFNGLKANVYERNKVGCNAYDYITNPNTTTGADKLFVNGTAGSDAVIRLFGATGTTTEIPAQVTMLRTKNWLINDAQLYLYVDEPDDAQYYPEKLYLYRYKDNKKLQVLDVLAYNTLGSAGYSFEGISKIDGKLYYNSNNKPDYYKFHITKYIAEILKHDTEEVLTDFGIKTYDVQDVPLSTADTLMRKYNTNFKGVVLQGRSMENTSRNMKLEIYYTEKN